MRKTVIVIALSVILTAGLAAAAPPESAQAEPSFAPSSIALRTPVNGWAAARLVVAGPEGFRVERSFFAGEPLAVDFSRLKDANGDRIEVADGRYKWELTLTAPIPGSTPQPESNNAPVLAWVSSGSFRVENGSFVAPQPVVREDSSATGEANGPIGPVGALTQNLGGNYFVGNVSVTGNLCAGAADCTDGLNPNWDIAAVDTLGGEFALHDLGTTEADTAYWGIYGYGVDGALLLQDAEHGTFPLTIEESTPTNTLYFDSQGYIGVANSTPADEIHIKSAEGNGQANLRLEAIDGDYAKLLIGDSWFGIGNYNGSAYHETFRIYNGAPGYIIDVKATGDLVLGGSYTNYAQLTVGHTTASTNGLVAPMIVTTYSSGTPTAGFGALTQWGLEAADGTMNTAADFGALWENASTKTAYLIFRAANNAAATEYMRIEGSSGYIGFGVANPAYPIHHSNGARLTTGGVWTDASSRALKQDIETLDAEAAMAAFRGLTPVTYAYKADPTEHHAGFIAEDVPDLVAANDRTGLAPMDVVAVLTKVVQEQQKTIDKLEARLAELEATRK